MRLSSTGAKALGLGRSGSAPLKLGLGGGGKESTLEKEMVKQLEETLKAKGMAIRVALFLELASVAYPGRVP